MPSRPLSRAGKHAKHILSWGSYLFAGIAGMSLVVMMGMIVVDVFCRYFLNTPLVGVYDLVKLAMVVITFCSLAYTSLKGAHITVDLFAPALARIRPRWLDGLLYRLVMVLASATLLWLAYLSWNRIPKSELMREASSMIGVPHYPFYGVIAAGLALYGLTLLADAVRGHTDCPPPETPDEQEGAK